MDRSMLYDYLQQAERHVGQGLRHIDKQSKLVAALERKGRDPSHAKALLNLFEQLQDLHVAHRDRLKDEFEAD